ncbi:Glutathione-dependent peroxiredoxin [uncultured Gammaproteobacteria bacterium]
MAIQVGDNFPSVTLKHLTDDGLKDISTDDLIKAGKVVLFAVPGAYTPTCSARHLPGFVENAAAIKAKGVDRIVCMAVNDPFVMRAWGDSQKVGDTVIMLPDGSGALTRALGQEFDISANNLGVRSQRFAMIIDGGVVKFLAVDKPGAFEVSSAEAVLAAL